MVVLSGALVSSKVVWLDPLPWPTHLNWDFVIILGVLGKFLSVSYYFIKALELLNRSMLLIFAGLDIATEVISYCPMTSYSQMNFFNRCASLPASKKNQSSVADLGHD